MRCCSRIRKSLRLRSVMSTLIPTIRAALPASSCRILPFESSQRSPLARSLARNSTSNARECSNGFDRRPPHHLPIVGVDDVPETLERQRGAIVLDGKESRFRLPGPCDSIEWNVPVPSAEPCGVEREPELLLARACVFLGAGPLLDDGSERHDRNPRHDQKQLNRQRVLLRRLRDEWTLAARRAPDRHHRIQQHRRAGAKGTESHGGPDQDRERRIQQRRGGAGTGLLQHEHDPADRQQRQRAGCGLEPAPAGNAAGHAGAAPQG